MLIFLSSVVLAATPSELAHVRYLEDTWRRDEAAAEAARLAAADPSDIAAHISYIHEYTSASPSDAHDLLRVYADWHAAAPDESVRRVALAWAIGRAAAAETFSDRLPEVAGVWCDQVLTHLEPVPVEPKIGARALWIRISAREVCGGDNTPDKAALAALAKTEDSAKFAHVAYALRDKVVDEALADAIVAMLAVEPWRMPLGALYAKDVAGPGLERARAAVLELARKTAATSDEPALLHAAWQALRRADLDDEADVVARKLRKLDPEIGGLSMGSDEHSGPKREPAPAVVGTAEQRLAASDARRLRDSRPWSRGRWHAERAEILSELGRDREALDHLEKAYFTEPGIQSNLRFAREAVRQNRKLASARSAAMIAVSTRGKWSIAYRAWNAEESGASLSEALLVRASVLRALNLPRKAAEDAKLAMQVHESADAHLILGLALVEWSRETAAFEHLVLGLADPEGATPALLTEARAAAEVLWAERGLWTPTGLDGWIAAVAAGQPGAESPAKPAAQDPADRPPFPDLTVMISGKPTLLSSIEGPLVVDLWATWCGPCIAAMPELDRAARTTPGVTFLAVSVDTEQATADGFFKAQTPAFTTAWAGWDAMTALGIHGIPMAYFLDDQHRIAAIKKGFSSDTGAFDDALAKIAGKP